MGTLETLVEQMQAGDDQAFAEVFAATKPFVERAVRSALYQYAPRHAQPWTVDEVLPDIVADVYVRLWQKRAGYMGPGNFYAWLRVIADHITVDFIRRHRHIWLHERTLDDQHEHLLVAGALRAFRDRETAEMVHDAMQTLSAGEQAAVQLHYIVGYRYTEVARMRGSSPDTVRTLLQRARPKLRRYFQDQ